RGHGDVGRWKAELAASAIAGLDGPPHLIRVAEQTGGSLDLPARKCRPDGGRRHRLVEARHRDEPDAHDVESKVGAKAPQKRNVAPPAAAEMEVFADDHRPRPQTTDEHLVDEVLRALARPHLVEV